MDSVTIPELAFRLAVKYRKKISEWKLRSIVDGLTDDLPRLGSARAIPRELIRQIEDQLIAEGWVQRVEDESAPEPPSLSQPDHGGDDNE